MNSELMEKMKKRLLASGILPEETTPIKEPQKSEIVGGKGTAEF
jgi:hypothetical protein